MKEDFKFNYVNGDFDKQYDSLKRYKHIYYLFTQAVYDGDFDLVKYSLERGADINKGVLELAILSGNLEMVKFLMDRGANILAHHYRTADLKDKEILNFLKK